MSEMGKRIRIKRLEKGLTMEELGNLLGVKASAINKYEKGIVENIKRPTIKKMAEIFDCDPNWLMGFTEPVIPTVAPGIAEIIDLFSRATSEQQQAVLNLLRSFVDQNNK